MLQSLLHNSCLNLDFRNGLEPGLRCRTPTRNLFTGVVNARSLAFGKESRTIKSRTNSFGGLRIQWMRTMCFITRCLWVDLLAKDPLPRISHSYIWSLAFNDRQSGTRLEPSWFFKAQFASESVETEETWLDSTWRCQFIIGMVCKRKYTMQTRRVSLWCSVMSCWSCKSL